MSTRIGDELLPRGRNFGQGFQNPMADLRRGGQMGYSNNLAELISNQQYIRKNVICLLLEAPTLFQEMDDPDLWVGTLRALVELHPLRITGLTSTVTLEFAETPVGGAGEMQEDVTDAKRERSQVVFTWNEKYGRPVSRFLEAWQRYFIMDADTKFALVNTLVQGPTDMLMDRFSASMIFIEPDQNHKTVVNAWLGTGMMPRTGGTVEGSRDMTAPGDKLDLEIGFTGVYQNNAGVTAFAQELLDGLSITGANPYTRQSFLDRISADVQAQNLGYGAGVSDLANSTIQV